MKGFFNLRDLSGSKGVLKEFRVFGVEVSLRVPLRLPLWVPLRVPLRVPLGFRGSGFRVPLRVPVGFLSGFL